MTQEEFVSIHEHDDVRRLALLGSVPAGVDLRAALQQIAGRQTARRKLPSWAAVEGLIYPPRLALEQCSGEAAALYKRRVAAQWLAEDAAGGHGATDGQRAAQGATTTLIDLTGGLGVDFWALAPLFARAVYVERQEKLCAAARHNFPRLGLHGAEVVNGDGIDHLRRLPEGVAATRRMIYLDPARRDANGRKTYAMEDCTPDVAALCPELLRKARRVMVKLSPMLDVHEAVAALRGVRAVHMVCAGGECKELLLQLDAMANQEAPLRMVCVNDGHIFNYTSAEAEAADREMATFPRATEGRCLLEPHAGVMKAGCFRLLERRFGVRPLSVNSHLFLADSVPPDFPGRAFRIIDRCTMNRRELRRALAGINSANVAVRNFPLTAAALRQRLRLADGGHLYLFGTTAADGSHLIFITERANGQG